MADDRVFLLPGEYHVARRPTNMATLLGSCVAVCLRNRVTGEASMNHFLLPIAAEANSSGRIDDADRGRYGDTAVRLIIDVMRRMDSNTSNLRARVYGGGAVVSHLDVSSDIGSRNVEVALQELEKARIKVVEQDTGGDHGRRIYFDTGADTVEVRQVRKTGEAARLAERRAELASRNTSVLVVDDSALVRKIVSKAVDETPGMEACGEAGDAFEARDKILSLNPDVVCLDIIMPKLDGLAFLQKLSAHYPTPVVICSTIAKEGSDIVRRAKALGAVEVVDKEELKLYQGMDAVKKELIPKLRRAATRAVRRPAT